MASRLSRRSFLKMAGLVTAGVLSGCAPKELPTAVPAPTSAEAEKVVEKVEEATPAPAKKVKITAFDLVAEDATGPGVFDRVKQEWFAAEFPNIEVEHLPYPSVEVENVQEYWVTLLTAGEGPSALHFHNSFQTIEMATIGHVQALDDYLPLYFPEWQDLYPIVQELSTYQGKIYQIPGNLEAVGYVVRRDYLEAAGYAIDYEPGNWSEWEKMVEDLTDDTHYGFFWSWMIGHFISANGGAEALEKDDKTITLHYTAPEVVEAVKLFKRLLDKGCGGKDILADFGTGLNDFQQGNSAVFPFFPSWLNWLFGTAKFQPEDLSFWPYPLGPHAQAGNSLIKPWMWTSTHSYLVNPHKDADERDAAARYQCWMHSKEMSKKQAEWWKENELKGVFASPFMDVDWASVSVGVPAWWAETVGRMVKAGGVSPAPDYKGGDYFSKALEKIFQDPGANIEAELTAAEELCKKEWLDEYHKNLQK
jgi:ABC-type glycerol-3-phosphate transport system substrate-binding protein